MACQTSTDARRTPTSGSAGPVVSRLGVCDLARASTRSRCRFSASSVVGEKTRSRKSLGHQEDQGDRADAAAADADAPAADTAAEADAAAGEADEPAAAAEAQAQRRRRRRAMRDGRRAIATLRRQRATRTAIPTARRHRAAGTFRQERTRPAGTDAARAHPAPTQKPSCANPNADASIAGTAVEPDYPDIARQQGAVGTTQVKVTLDASGSVTAQAFTSRREIDPGPAAVKAARATRYSPETVDCVKTAGSYIFRADFTGQ